MGVIGQRISKDFFEKKKVLKSHMSTLKKVNVLPKRYNIVQRVVNYFDQKEIMLCTNNYLLKLIDILCSF